MRVLAGSGNQAPADAGRAFKTAPITLYT